MKIRNAWLTAPKRANWIRLCSCCPPSHGQQPIIFYGSVPVPSAPVQVPSQCHMPRVSHQSHVSANDKGTMKGNWEKFTDIPCILTPARRTTDEGCATSHRLKWGHLRTHSTSGRWRKVRISSGKMKERKERRKEMLHLNGRINWLAQRDDEIRTYALLIILIYSY